MFDRFNPNSGGLYRGSFCGSGGDPLPMSETFYSYVRNLKFGTEVH